MQRVSGVDERMWGEQKREKRKKCKWKFKKKCKTNGRLDFTEDHAVTQVNRTALYSRREQTRRKYKVNNNYRVISTER